MRFVPPPPNGVGFSHRRVGISHLFAAGNDEKSRRMMTRAQDSAEAALGGVPVAFPVRDPRGRARFTAPPTALGPAGRIMAERPPAR
jgi:hypothetical protein